MASGVQTWAAQRRNREIGRHNVLVPASLARAELGMLLSETMCRHPAARGALRQKGMDAMLSKISIDQVEAQLITAACIEEASARGVAVSVAVVDDAGNLLTFNRMNGARPHTVDLAIRKAKVAVAAGVGTKRVDAAVKAGLISNVDIVGWGGLPAFASESCAGGVGLSGAAPDIDEAIAQAGLAALAGS